MTMKRNITIVSILVGVFFGIATLAYDIRVEASVGLYSVPTPTASPTPSPSPKGTPPTIKEDDDTGIIRIDAELVNLSVRVIDRNNRSVNDIKQSDFKVFEDGVLQQIEFFSRSDVPTNYSLVVDNSGSMRPLLEKVIEAGKILINTNRADDETSIIRFVGRDKISIEQSFTPNKADLTDSLDNLFIEGGQTAIIDAVYLAVENVEEYQKSKKVDERKRRAIILVSDGEDRDSFYAEKQLFDLLRESEVQIYVVGFVSELSKEGGFIGKSPQGKAKGFLERLATETGGKAYFPSNGNDLPQIAKEISSELRTQYSLGYIPSNDRRDGSFRNIKVAVTDGPNSQKRIAISRAGRTAENDNPPSNLVKPSPTPTKP